MRAFVLDDFGVPPRLAEMPVPMPQTGEIQVYVQASSVNSFDSMLVAGWLKAMYPHEFPVVLGKDFAGTVSKLGEGVDEFQVGDRVFGVVVRPRLTDGGGFAEYAITSASVGVAPVPEGLSLDVAGVVGLAGSTAAAAVDSIGENAEGIVLVSGATGGVGVFVVQMLVARGARVIATAASQPGADMVRELGAETVVDYRDDMSARVKELRPSGVDAVVHLAGDAVELAELIVEGGVLASPMHIDPMQMHRRDIDIQSVTAQPDRQLLDWLAAEVNHGNFRVPVTRTYQFGELSEALSDFASGKTGKLAVALR
ncbi:NADP-dependent oxidoreductase [Mycobacterium avium]|uniref:NADP-dependent oxidoreductase n=1 Tax=Mycobacterium avium TaxID=1764 RepID=UPI0007A036A6|nr:NADP-dependent oxidoreductase [Mycobacterium avium]